MPAPSSGQIQLFLTNALLAEGFNNKTYVEGVYTVDPTTLPPDMERLVKALSTGLSSQWKAWQAAQVVQIPITSTPGSPSVGILP